MKKVNVIAILLITITFVYIFYYQRLNKPYHSEKEYMSPTKHWSVNLEEFKESETNYIQGDMTLILQTSLKLILNDYTDITQHLRNLGTYEPYPYKNFFSSHYTVDFLTQNYRTSINIERSSKKINYISISRLNGDLINLSNINLGSMKFVNLDIKTREWDLGTEYFLLRQYKLINKDIDIEYQNHFSSMEEINYYENHLDELNQITSIKISN